MNNKSTFSIRGAAYKMLVAIRKKLNWKPKYSVADVAKLIGLPVVYPEHRPANFKGFLLLGEFPAIAVNADLPAHEQAFTIAQHIAFYQQQTRCNSLALDQPWKWEMLDAAPPELHEKLSQLDEIFRAHLIMLNHASGDEFRAHLKADYKRLFGGSEAVNIVWFHLFKLRIKIGFIKFCRKVIFIGHPAS